MKTYHVYYKGNKINEISFKTKKEKEAYEKELIQKLGQVDFVEVK